jgi:hypothetical protein
VSVHPQSRHDHTPNVSSATHTGPVHCADVRMWSAPLVASRLFGMLASNFSSFEVWLLNAPFIRYRRQRTEETPSLYTRPSGSFSQDAAPTLPDLFPGGSNAAPDQGNPTEEEMGSVFDLESRQHSLGEAGADSTMGIVHKVLVA